MDLHIPTAHCNVMALGGDEQADLDDIIRSQMYKAKENSNSPPIL